MIYGIGTDLVELTRLGSIDLTRLANKICTKQERAALPHHPARLRETLAGRFAAKEAVSKACGTGIGAALSWQDIEILADERGKPVIYLSSQAQARLFPEQAIQIHLSITHTEQYALAMVVLEQSITEL